MALRSILGGNLLLIGLGVVMFVCVLCDKELYSSGLYGLLVVEVIG